MREMKGKKEMKVKNSETKKKDKRNEKKEAEEAPTGYIHVRARRGQATDSHSLAERVRRERISERMKLLQTLVPGCEKVTGKALMLDEIINYVQSLQNQVESRMHYAFKPENALSSSSSVFGSAGGLMSSITSPPPRKPCYGSQQYEADEELFHQKFVVGIIFDTFRKMEIRDFWGSRWKQEAMFLFFDS